MGDSIMDEIVNRLLHFTMVYCFAQGVFGRQIKRLGTRIAMIGEPKRDDCYRPNGYVEGGWRS